MESRHPAPNNDEDLFWTKGSVFQLDREIDRGKFGVVYLAYKPGSPDYKKAIKITNDGLESLESEVKLHNKIAKKLKKRSVPAVEIAATRDKTKMGLVMNYYEEGNLESYLRKSSLLIEEHDQQNQLLEKIRKQLKEIYAALEKTHYVHRDLACRNILVKIKIDKHGKEHIRLLLSDYGHAIDLKKQASIKADINAAIPVYTTPSEAYLEPHQISKQTDRFAMQVTLLEASVLLFGGSLSDILKDESGDFLTKRAFVERLKAQGDQAMLKLLMENTKNFITQRGGKLSDQFEILDPIISVYHTDEKEKPMTPYWRNPMVTFAKQGDASQNSKDEVDDEDSAKHQSPKR